MTASNSESLVLSLTADQLADWRREIVEIVQELDRLTERKAHLEGKVAAYMVLAQDAAPLEKPKDASLTEWVITDNTTLAAAVKISLGLQVVGRTTMELSSHLKQTAIRAKIVRSPGAIYTVIKRLVDLEEIVKHGTLLYAPSVYQRVKSGELIDPRFAAARDTKPDFRTVVLEALSGAPRGLTAGELRDQLSTHPDYGARVSARPNYVYNSLSRMVESTQIKRVGTRYYLSDAEVAPSQNEEATLI